MSEASSQKLPTWQLILAVACEVVPLGDTFTKELILVECWRRYPERFAMEGYPQYPHAQRVWCKLTSSEPLLAKNLIEQVSESTYAVTDNGRKFLKKLLRS